MRITFLQERFEFDGISRKHTRLVAGENHTLSETGIKSDITLGLNVTNKNSYRCEFKILPNKVCSKVIGIKFQGKPFSSLFSDIYISLITSGI